MSRKHVEATVSGLRVRSFSSAEGKKEESLGQLKLSLIADKEEIKVNEALGLLSINDVISALSMHQAAKDEIEIKLTFTVSEEDYQRILDARRPARPVLTVSQSDFNTDD